MAKQKNDYFQMTYELMQCCEKGARLLEEMMCDFSVGDMAAKKDEMHEIEHRADNLHHNILTKLSAEFITPIDQEDILRLVQIIDDVMDALDEVALEFYMYDITRIPGGAAEFSGIISRCVKALLEAVKELKNFKKPARLRELLVEVNTIESEADSAYVEALHNLFAAEPGHKTLVGSKAIYESLEHCCDLCEHAADVIEQIIIKNT